MVCNIAVQRFVCFFCHSLMPCGGLALQGIVRCCKARGTSCPLGKRHQGRWDYRGCVAMNSTDESSAEVSRPLAHCRVDALAEIWINLQNGQALALLVGKWP